VQQFPIDHVTAGSTDAVEGEIGRGQEALRQRQRLGLLLTAAIGIPLVGLAFYLVSSARRPASAADLAATSAASATPTKTTDPVNGRASAAAVATPISTSTSTTSAPAHASGSAPTSASASAANAVNTASPRAGTLPTPDTLRILVAADGPCWVRLRGDGNVHFQGLMQAGDKQTGDAKDNVDIVIGDAAMFRYSINGQPGKVLGKPGQVVVAHITRANWQDWLQH
jgi:hypothetical protein